MISEQAREGLVVLLLTWCDEESVYCDTYKTSGVLYCSMLMNVTYVWMQPQQRHYVQSGSDSEGLHYPLQNRNWYLNFNTWFMKKLKKNWCKLSRDDKTKGVKQTDVKQRLIVFAAKVVVKARSYGLENVDTILRKKALLPPLRHKSSSHLPNYATWAEDILHVVASTKLSP